MRITHWLSCSGHLEQLCAKDDADQLLCQLLKKFNAVTGLSGWSDPKQLH